MIELRCCMCNRLKVGNEWHKVPLDPEKYYCTSHGFCNFCIEDVYQRAFGEYRHRYTPEWWDRINKIVEEIRNSPQK